MQHWNLLTIDAARGTRDPYVLHQDDGTRSVLIVLAPGQELGDHQVKEHAWVAVVEGSIQVAAGGEQVELGQGSLVRFDAGERHSVASAGGARILMLLAPWPGPGHYAPGEA
jgi:quercetin dioxygenase-like cupin family protein